MSKLINKSLNKIVTERVKKDEGEMDFVYMLHDRSTPTGLSLCRADYHYQTSELNGDKKEQELWKNVFNIILSRRIYELTGELVDPYK